MQFGPEGGASVGQSGLTISRKVVPSLLVRLKKFASDAVSTLGAGVWMGIWIPGFADAGANVLYASEV
jgi:hypothetical protein